MDNLIIPKKPRTYIPQNLQMEWANLEPIFDELLKRAINSVEELEKWLADKSELEAALEEDFAWRYIKMSCDTANENLVKDFQYFATEIEPKIECNHIYILLRMLFLLRNLMAKILHSFIKRKCKISA